MLTLAAPTKTCFKLNLPPKRGNIIAHSVQRNMDEFGFSSITTRKSTSNFALNVQFVIGNAQTETPNLRQKPPIRKPKFRFFANIRKTKTEKFEIRKIRKPKFWFF